MASRFLTAPVRAVLAGILLGAGICAAALPASAEPGSGKEPAAKAAKPVPRSLRTTNNLDVLFGALKAAPDAESAKAIEERIWQVWLVSKSDTTNLLMRRVKSAIDGEDLDLAIQILDSVIKLKPDYVEAWNRRATVYYLKKNYGRAMADIQQVLVREPRHFGALSGMGMILQEIGDEKHALEVFRKALEVNPHLPKIPDMVKTLTEKVEGRDI